MAELSPGIIDSASLAISSASDACSLAAVTNSCSAPEELGAGAAEYEDGVGLALEDALGLGAGDDPDELTTAAVPLNPIDATRVRERWVTRSKHTLRRPVLSVLLGAESLVVVALCHEGLLKVRLAGPIRLGRSRGQCTLQKNLPWPEA